MFQPVSPKLDVLRMEEEILAFWKAEDIFHRTLQQREGQPEYVFYEGPPTANGKPGIHHVLGRVIKDLFPRYKTMRGYHVTRRGGWDTHGLPVEIEVEKKLGFTNKHQIEEFGIARFNDLCRASAFEYIQDWERLTDRIGFWVDLQDAYITYQNEYIESVWWILKNFWERGLLYRDFKVVPYCPRDETPLSDHEVAQGYREVEDPSITVRFSILGQADSSFLVWTTTPWTLPANVAIAVNPEVDYVKVEHVLHPGHTEYLILAEALLPVVFGDQPVRVFERMKGSDLAGMRYEPLFSFLPLEKPANRVVLADFVTTADGTGLVHIAPAFGADDMAVAQREDLPLLQTVQPDGRFRPEVQPWSGVFVKHADPFIIQNLAERGLLFRSGAYRHSYPFCWRCGTPLLYYALPTWFIRTSSFKERMVALNQQVNWIPPTIKNGRFGNWLENNIDWALGRNRYWGTPLPVWECAACGYQEMVGSLGELSEKSGRDLSGLSLHRPFVDEVTYPCPRCAGQGAGGVMRRVLELIDVWFDSGSMPYAQWHYPFENQVGLRQHYPADFICEGIDQTRGWFYSLHAISTLLFDQICYKNVISYGLILDAEGLKMSKSRGNILDPWEVISQHGADATRWYLYTASPPGQERRFSTELVGEVVRGFTLTLWNTYSFFVTYANLDGWFPQLAEQSSNVQPQYSPLDRWLRSALHTLVRDVTQAYETYDVTGATRPVEAFVDQLSNWYLRRSRRRFWKSESDQDKLAAYATLYEALATLARLLAPAMPFLAETLYQNLSRSGAGAQGIAPDSAPLSVHLAGWPEADRSAIDETLNQEMALVMRLASLGHAARNKANRKVRQPLAEAAFAVRSAAEAQVVDKYADLLEDELNVKQVRTLSAAGEAAAYQLNPLPKQLGQKYGSRFPGIRQALLGLDAEPAALKLMQGQPLEVALDGQTYTILPEEVEVRAQARSGYAVAADGPYLAALVITLTPALVREGLAREFVRRVQDLRKTAGLDIADRIRLVYQASPELAEAIAEYSDYIMNETLAVELRPGPVSGGLAQGIPAQGIHAQFTDSFDGETVSLALERVV